MLIRINNRPSTTRADWILTQKIYSRLSNSFHSRNEDIRTQPKRSLGRCLSTKQQQMTCYMARQPHLQNYLRMVSIHAIPTTLSHWHWPSKKITTLNKRCYPKEQYWQFSSLTFTLRPYNSYYRCEIICIRRVESLAKYYY